MTLLNFSIILTVCTTLFITLFTILFTFNNISEAQVTSKQINNAVNNTVLKSSM